MLDRPIPRQPERWRSTPPPAALIIAWRLVYQLVLFVAALCAVLAVLLTLTLFAAVPSRSAGYGYCQLWSRAVTEIEVRGGRSLSLIFLKDELVFQSAADVDIAVADSNLVEIRNNQHYRVCRMLAEYDELPLPDVASVQTPVWAKMLEAHAVGRQGTAPAGDAPIAAPSAEGDGWAEACAETWRTFDPSDGTVVRPASKGGKVRCPLVKGDDGLWVIP
jgi:hypothetical protein